MVTDDIYIYIKKSNNKKRQRNALQMCSSFLSVFHPVCSTKPPVFQSFGNMTVSVTNQCFRVVKTQR